MKCEIVSLALVAATSVLLCVDGAKAQSTGRIRFLRPLQRHWAQSAGRSASASTGRGLMKHLMMFKNMWQQPSSNVIIITRPTTTQNDDTTTATNTPTGTGTRAFPRLADNKAVMNDDDAEADGDGIEVLRTDTQSSLKGVNDKISTEGMQGSGVTQRKRNNRRHKKRRNSANQNSKRRKQIIDVENILKREEDRRSGLESRRSSGRRTTARPVESTKYSGNFMRFVNSFRLPSPSAIH